METSRKSSLIKLVWFISFRKPRCVISFQIVFPSELNNDTQCNMIESLIYKKYQRRIYHDSIILHPSHYLITTQNQSFNSFISFQIVYLVSNRLTRPKIVFVLIVKNTFGRLVNNIQTFVTRLTRFSFRINKPPKGKLTIIRFGRYLHNPHT